MKILHLNRESLARLGIDSAQSTQKYPFNVKNVMCILWFAMMNISAFMFLITEAGTFKEYVAVVNEWISLFFVYIEFLLHVWNMEKLFKFITNFENLIQKRSKNPESKTLYEKSIQQVDKCVEMQTFAFLNVTLHFMMWPMLIASYITYYTTDLQSEAFQVPFYFWAPFDWKNPFGYVFAFAIEYVTAFYIMSTLVSQTGLIIGCYWLLIALANDLARDLIAINATKINRLKLKRDLIRFLQFQSDTKRIVSNFLDAYEFNITTHFLWTILEICGYLLLIQIELSQDRVDISALLPLLFQTIWTFIFIFIYCELGQRVSESFDKPYDAISQFKFQLFPLDVQQMLPVIIVGAQQPIDLRGYGNISCTRERFKGVVNGGFSYFMMLRTQ